MNIKTTFAAILTCMVLAVPAQAATVASGVTQIGDGGGIDLQGPAVATAAFDFGVAPLAGSDWVWGSDFAPFTSATFEFAFDLTGFDVSTASLAGLIVVDNEAIIKLNGVTIGSFLGDVLSHFQQTNAYGTSDASLFNAGANLLTFDVTDLGGGFGLRANVEVTADAAVAPVPLPATGLLLAGGLLLVARRRS